MIGDYLKMFPSYNILMFDFRTHGQSEGRYRTLGCHEYKDVIAAADFLKAKTKVNDSGPKRLPLFILGHSMGGSTVLKAFEYEPNLCDGLILDSSFSNLQDVVYNTFRLKSGLPTWPFVFVVEKMVNFLASCDLSKMRPIDVVKKIKKPIFFMHSCVDKVVPPNDSLLMYAQCASEKKKLWIGPKCQHGDLRKECFDIYKGKVRKFLKEALATV